MGVVLATRPGSYRFLVEDSWTLSAVGHLFVNNSQMRIVAVPTRIQFSVVLAAFFSMKLDTSLKSNLKIRNGEGWT